MEITDDKGRKLLLDEPNQQHEPLEDVNKVVDSTSYLGKVVLLVEGLAGREYEPMTLDEMTKKSGFDKASVLRILQGLEALGWAEQKEKSWRLAPRLIR